MSDLLLLETGGTDNLLLENADDLLLETVGPTDPVLTATFGTLTASLVASVTHLGTMAALFGGLSGTMAPPILASYWDAQLQAPAWRADLVVLVE